MSRIYLRSLEEQVGALEEKLRAYEGTPELATRRGRTTRGPPRGQPCPEENPNDEEFEDEHPLLEPFNQLRVGFVGAGAADNFLRSLRDMSGLGGDDESLDLIPKFYEPGALPSRREVLGILAYQARLPPVDFCRRLFAAQYTYIGTIFAFSDPHTFDQLLIEAHRGPPDVGDREACLSYAKVLMILAFGQLYSVNQWIDFKGPPGFECFTHALQLLPEPHEEGSIVCVETLALIGYFMQNMNRRDAAFLYIGMALRMAISLGLHQEVSSGGVPELDEVTREHRRRVWWSIYSLDRILSVKSGNPLTIQDEDIGVNLPSKLPNEADYCPAVVLRHYTELSRILGEVTKSIYRRNSTTTPKSGKRLMASVQSIILSLSNWNRDLPDELRFAADRLSISRESVSTFSHYYQCINMTVRPLLFHVVGKRLREIRTNLAEKEHDWKEGLSQPTIRVIEMCISAAQETTNMMTIAAQRDLVATYGYMDGEHIFSAAIVLVMVCVAFPTSTANTTAMNAGLHLLRGMAERGNSHMGARYELLVHLRNTFMPGHAAKTPSPAAFFPTTTSPSSLFSTLSSPGMNTQLNTFISPSAAQLADVTTEMTTASGAHRFGARADYPSMNATTGTGTGFPIGIDIPAFSMADENALREPFYDDSMSLQTDFGLWEEGFANPALDAGFDFIQFT